MRLQRLKLKNFKSFVGEHEFDFCGGLKGLHFITGENLVSKKLEGNGVGKSSIWDAVCWCFYGRTLRGLKASNVASWQVGKNCEVEVALSIKGESFTFYRSWSPNKLTINGSPVEQHEVENYISLTFESFQHALVLGQFSTMFFDLQPSAKLSLFSQVLSLDFWLQKSEEAKIMVKDIGTEITEVESRIRLLEGAVKHLGDMVDSHIQSRDAFEEDRKKRIKVYADDAENHQKAADEESGRYEETGILYKDAKRRLERFEKEQEHMDKLFLQKEITLRAEREKFSEAKVKCLAAKERLINFQDLSEAHECPTCYGQLGDAHVKKVLKDLEKQYADLSKLYIEQKEILDRYCDEMDGFNKALSDFSRRKQEVRAEVYALDSRMIDIQARYKYHANLVNKCKSQIESETKSVNPFNEKIDIAKEKVAAAKAELKSKKEELDASRADREAVEYWVKGFKDVRLFLIEEALLTLEVEVNNNLLQLGLKDWKIKFDVERETKSGTVSKGFQVMITSPANSEPVPWESWSGGETQRLRVAGTLGLSNLICAKLGVQSDFLVLDEPTTHLNPKGVEALMMLLENKARLENKQIWVVDHRALDYGGFASITKVTKDKEGSFIETEIRSGE